MDLELLLYRTPSRRLCTIGMLFVSPALKRFCYTLEDPVREVVGKPVADWKIAGKTASPAGRYEIIMSMSTRFKKLMPELLNVPGFAGVRMHAGNTAEDTDGCILVGMHVAEDLSSVTESGVARDALYKLINEAIAAGKRVYITIIA